MQFLIDMEEFYEACEWIMKQNQIELCNGKWGCGDTAIYESSQGLLLDKDIGFFPHCTPSNVGTKYFRDRFESHACPDYYLVTRAYQTRHGNGPMTNHGNFKPNPNPNEKNLDNGKQGKFKTSMLDLELLRYAIEKDGGLGLNNSTLVVTCIEHMPKLVFWDGEIIECGNRGKFVMEIADRLSLLKCISCEDHVFREVRKYR
jgi:adenylosuccinate synthase